MDKKKKKIVKIRALKDAVLRQKYEEYKQSHPCAVYTYHIKEEMKKGSVYGHFF